MRNLWFALLLVTGIAWTAESGDPWSAGQAMETPDLVKLFQGGSVPEIIMVGPRILYNGNHIKAAVFAGPAGTEQGIALLQQQAAKFPKNASIVLYCGCCPMDRCPNIRPAFLALRDAGFRNVKILRIPANLTTDWTAKGFPVEKGDIAK